MHSHHDSLVADCPLCFPGTTQCLWQDHLLWVILADEPSHPGYTRVIWRRHVKEMTELPIAEREHLMAVVWVVEQVQRRILQPDKINLASLGNQVPHLHWHIIPRWRHDPYFPGSIWGVALAAQATQWANDNRLISHSLAKYQAALKSGLEAKRLGQAL